MKSFDYVRFAGEMVVPSGRFPPRHFALNLLKSIVHLRLQASECRVQNVAASSVHLLAHQSAGADFLEGQVAENFVNDFGGQVHQFLGLLLREGKGSGGARLGLPSPDIETVESHTVPSVPGWPIVQSLAGTFGGAPADNCHLPCRHHVAQIEIPLAINSFFTSALNTLHISRYRYELH